MALVSVVSRCLRHARRWEAGWSKLLSTVAENNSDGVQTDGGKPAPEGDVSEPESLASLTPKKIVEQLDRHIIGQASGD